MLFHRISIYVPSTQNVGKPLPVGKHEALVTEVAKQFSKHFGGATATNGEGFYAANDGKLIRERVTIVTSYHGLETSEALAIVIPIAQVIKYRYGQESIAIETEQGIDFI
jgi:hypothetical protein